MKLLFRFSVAAAVALWVAAGPADARQELGSGPTEQTAADVHLGNWRVDGDGILSGSTQELSIRAQDRNLFGGPFFLSVQGKVGQQRLRPYDLHRWGGQFGGGWALDERSDLSAGYRIEEYSVFNVSRSADAAFRNAAGRSAVGAFEMAFSYDGRDDPYYATAGRKLKLNGRLALRGWGGDYSFGRLDGDAAFYWTPWKERGTGALWEELTFAEHLRLGWMSPFGASDQVPFFERYFAGGESTVRGHRGDWLTPRRLDDQFIGGEAEFVNNVEARLPIFKEAFHRRLSAVTFFDVGRAYRRFSHFGDFGYGAGVGLRYVVHVWKIHGVLRADYGVNPAPEGDDSTSALHITFGSPF